MANVEGLVPRLETLFGGVWQAALDHAGIMSRRRARGIGAGSEPSGSLWVIVELLEQLPPTEWPERWRGFGKLSETCPTLAMCPERLVDGCIRPKDAVLVWDLRQEAPGGLAHHVNVAVGFFPSGCFGGLSRADAARTRWRLWYGQWDDCHGGAAAAGWMTSEDETPEGKVAGWVAQGLIDGADLDMALSVLSQNIVGFSPGKVAEIAGRLRARQPLAPAAASMAPSNLPQHATSTESGL